MKRLLVRICAVLVVLSMLICFVACKSEGSASDTPAETTSVEKEETTSEADIGGDVIKVGVVLPFTGSQASIGEQCKRGFQLGIDQINEEGGISSMNGAKIEVIYADSTGDSTVGMTEAERLITQENVSVLAGCYSSSVTYAVQDVAERYKVPMLVLLASADNITERNYKYTFRINVGMSYVMPIFGEYLDYLMNEQGHDFKKLAIIYETSDLNKQNAETWRNMAKELGMEVVVDESYSADITDMTSIVTKIKNAQPDVLFSGSYLADMILLAQTMDSMDVKLDLWIGGGSGEQEPEFLQTLGNLANHVLSPKTISIDMLKARPTFNTLNEQYFEKYGGKEESGGLISQSSSMSYSNAWVLYDVLERAASSDPEDIRKAFTETNITDVNNRALAGVPYDEIKFDENGQCWSFSCVTQMIDGVWRTMYPTSMRDPDFNEYPVG